MIAQSMITMTLALCSLTTFCLAQGENPIKTEDKTAMTAKTNPRVTFETTKGSFTVELYSDKAPATVANFLQYAKDGFYEGTIFHRVIPGFMAQGGGFSVDFKQKPARAPIKIESQSGLSNTRGTIAMARTMDPNSATAQFFINVVDNRALDYVAASQPGYAVFGKVVDGMNVIDDIVKVKTVRNGGHENVPLDPIEIESVTVKE